MLRVRGLPSRGRARRRRAQVVVGLCLIAGCQGLAPDWQGQTIAASEFPLRFEWSDVDPELTERVVRRDARSSNQLYLARFMGADAVAVLAALKTGPSYVVEERATESYVADLLADTKLDWGETGRAPSPLGAVPYRMFRIAANELSCVGFGQPVGESADDRGRKNDLVFGYFCRVETQPLSAAVAKELIGKIALAERR